MKMPGIIKVKIIAGRDLPVMDRATETADAFVEVIEHIFAVFENLALTILSSYEIKDDEL